MSVQHLVKLAMLVEGVLPLSCYRKKLQNFSHLVCGLQIARFESSLFQCVGILQEKVYTIRSFQCLLRQAGGVP